VDPVGVEPDDAPVHEARDVDGRDERDEYRRQPQRRRAAVLVLILLALRRGPPVDVQRGQHGQDRQHEAHQLLRGRGPPHGDEDGRGAPCTASLSRARSALSESGAYVARV